MNFSSSSWHIFCLPLVMLRLCFMRQNGHTFFQTTIPSRGEISHPSGCDIQKTFNLLTFDWGPKTWSAEMQNEMESTEFCVTADETSFSETIKTNGFIAISLIHSDLMFLHWIWLCTGTGSTGVTGVIHFSVSPPTSCSSNYWSSLDSSVNHLKDSQKK